MDKQERPTSSYLKLSKTTPNEFVLRFMRDPESEPALVYYAYTAQRERIGLPEPSVIANSPLNDKEKGERIKKWYQQNAEGTLPHPNCLFFDRLVENTITMLTLNAAAQRTAVDQRTNARQQDASEPDV